MLYIFKTLKFDQYTAQISLRDKVDHSKYIGSDENWERAEKAIIDSAAEKGLKTKVVYGEAAFYGPKLDFMVKDAIGRQWQLGTIQVDYNLPERFGLEYTGADDKKYRPIMIHRAPFGSMRKVVPDAPQEVLLVLDGSTGQNAFIQAREFSKATQITALAITKLDGTAKGGVVIGIANELQIPVKFVGVGEKIEDLQIFDKTAFVESIFR